MTIAVRIVTSPGGRMTTGNVPRRGESDELSAASHRAAVPGVLF